MGQALSVVIADNQVALAREMYEQWPFFQVCSGADGWRRIPVRTVVLHAGAVA